MTKITGLPEQIVIFPLAVTWFRAQPHGTGVINVLSVSTFATASHLVAAYALVSPRVPSCDDQPADDCRLVLGHSPAVEQLRVLDPGEQDLDRPHHPVLQA